MPSGEVLAAALTALALGLRHGIDVDHVAALSDITGSQPSPRRAIRLATVYALGHGAMVLALGMAAIALHARLPAGIDELMARVVGGTLLALGGYLAVSLVRQGADARPRSRWMLVIAAVRVAAAKLERRAARPRELVIDHTHDHDHLGAGHGHLHLAGEHGEQGEHGDGGAVALRHDHRHRHVALVPADPFGSYGASTVLAVGLLHGIGAETPTQILVLAAATHAGGSGAAVGLLVGFVVGVLIANTAVAALAIVGFSRAASRRRVTVALSSATAGFSIVAGLVLLTGGG